MENQIENKGQVQYADNHADVYYVSQPHFLRYSTHCNVAHLVIHTRLKLLLLYAKILILNISFVSPLFS